MSIREKFDEYERQAKQLEQIARTFNKRSAKYVALERAAWALAFAMMHHRQEFEKFVCDHRTRELSADELAYLKRLGITS
jgi:hypothetical protein